MCRFSTIDSKLVCSGLWHNFECKATAKFSDPGKINQTLIDVKMVPRGFTWTQWSHEHKATDSVKQIDLLSVAKEGLVNDFTFRNNDKDVKMSFVASESDDNNAIWIQDEKCWSNLATLVKDVKPEWIRMAIELKHDI